MIRCSQCSSLVAEGLAACTACGTPTTAGSPPTPFPAQPPTPSIPPTPLPPTTRTPPLGAPQGEGAGATIFHSGRVTAEPAVVQVVAAEPATRTSRRGPVIGMGLAGALVVVVLAAGLTKVILGPGKSNTTTTATSTSITTTSTATTVPKPVPRAKITAPIAAAEFPLRGAPAVPVGVSLQVDGDASDVKVSIVIDDLAQPPVALVPMVNVTLGPGPHALRAKLVTASGESSLSEPVTITVLRPGTCGDLCFNVKMPNLQKRPSPNVGPLTTLLAPSTVKIVCQQPGGQYPEGNWWAKVDDGFWVADYFLDTPKPAPAAGIPSC